MPHRFWQLSTKIVLLCPIRILDLESPLMRAPPRISDLPTSLTDTINRVFPKGLSFHDGEEEVNQSRKGPFVIPMDDVSQVENGSTNNSSEGNLTKICTRSLTC